ERLPRSEFSVPLGPEAWPPLNVVARGPAPAPVLQSACGMQSARSMPSRPSEGLHTSRTRELGIRTGWERRRNRVLREVVRQATLPVEGDIVLGRSAALAAGPLLRRFTFKVRPEDPRTPLPTAA